MFTKFLFCMSISILSSSGKHLPSFIKPCRMNDTNFDGCVKNSATSALPLILKGNQELKIPSFLPFYVPLVQVQPSPGLFFKLIDLELHGLDTAEIRDIKFDLNKNTFMLKLFTDHSETVSQYEVNGKLLSFAVYGTGAAKITSVNATTNVFLSYDLSERDGKKYVNISSIQPDIDYNPGIVHYNFDNLFGGNKLLGDNINKFMNENPDEIEDITKIPNTAVIKAIILQVLKSILRGVSFDEVFP